MKIKKIFDNRIAEILDRYSDTQATLGTDLQKSISKAEDAEIIIPVLGMQGMGKSTLINGLLEENILPNAADETTCVPVEIKYGTDERAVVHFKNSASTCTIHTLDELNVYVDNNYNPANEKKVSHIELFRTRELLRNGLVIVDLPGVGSLTKENEETTKRYVENLCSAIFVIPTVPTLRRKEALFIKSLWSQFSRAMFVQNDWGESDQEKQESIDYNGKLLQQIADELHNPFDNDIILVNAYEAVRGAMEKDALTRANSNITALYQKVRSLVDNWEELTEKQLLIRLELSLSFAQNAVFQRIEAISKSKAELEAEKERKRKEFLRGTSEINDKVESAKLYLRDTETDIFFFSKKMAEECAKLIRAGIHKVIGQGVYDGDRLSQAFEDIQEMHVQSTMEEVVNRMIEVQNEVRRRFDDLLMAEVQNDVSINGNAPVLEAKLKWEKGMNVGFHVAGGVAGYAGAAPLRVALGVSNPVSLVVAGVGLVIYGVFCLAGHLAKKRVQAKRADEAKRAVNPVIDEMERMLQQEIMKKYSEFSADAFVQLEQILSRRAETGRKLEESLNTDVDPAEEQSLRQDLEYITEKQKLLQHV